MSKYITIGLICVTVILGAVLTYFVLQLRYQKLLNERQSEQIKGLEQEKRMQLETIEKDKEIIERSAKFIAKIRETENSEEATKILNDLFGRKKDAQ